MRLRSASTASTVSPATAVSPPTSTASPSSPLCAAAPASRSRSACRWSIAGAASGSLSRITASRAARALTSTSGAPGDLLLRPDHRGHAGLARHQVLEARQRRGIARAATTSISVGETIPGANPRDASSAA